MGSIITILGLSLLHVVCGIFLTVGCVGSGWHIGGGGATEQSREQRRAVDRLEKEFGLSLSCGCCMLLMLLYLALCTFGVEEEGEAEAMESGRHGIQNRQMTERRDCVPHVECMMRSFQRRNLRW